MWNASSGQLLATLQGHSNNVNSAEFSPDGQRIVTASEDKTARLWNASSGQLLATLQGHTDGVESALFSPDGQRIVTASEDKTARYSAWSRFPILLSCYRSKVMWINRLAFRC